MESLVICKGDFKTLSEYRKKYADAQKRFECKVKVDDGHGGVGWKFFENRQDMETWKHQK